MSLKPERIVVSSTCDGPQGADSKPFWFWCHDVSTAWRVRKESPRLHSIPGLQSSWHWPPLLGNRSLKNPKGMPFILMSTRSRPWAPSSAINSTNQADLSSAHVRPCPLFLKCCKVGAQKNEAGTYVQRANWTWMSLECVVSYQWALQWDSADSHVDVPG